MKSVLILEDDRSVLDLLCLILVSKGYSVVAATTAEEALQVAARRKRGIDLLIADIVLTFSSGIQVGVNLRRRMPCLKMLLISGYPEAAWRSEDLADLSRLPTDAFSILQKPFLPEMLVAKVGQLI